MPSVEQYDWDKLKPKPKIKTTANFHKGTKEFPTYQYIEPKRGSKNGAIKITKLPVKGFFTCSKCKTDCETRLGLKQHWLLEH